MKRKIHGKFSSFIWNYLLQCNLEENVENDKSIEEHEQLCKLMDRLYVKSK